MLNANDFLKMVKKAALEAVEASQPFDFCFGKVSNIKPLKVSVDQKLTLGTAQLVLTETISKASLKMGDEVILLKKKGGQKYLVLDRVVKAS